METEEVTRFVDLDDGEVFVFINIPGLCVKGTFPGQPSAEDIPPPNYFEVNFPERYAHSGNGMRVIRLTWLQELSVVIETLTKAGIIE